MIGVDITNIKRFLNKDLNFVKRVLSEAEIEIYLRIKNEDSKAKFLARTWAIKEAIFKADNSYVNFNKITILKKEGRYCFEDFLISTSDEENFLIAFVTKK